MNLLTDQQHLRLNRWVLLGLIGVGNAMQFVVDAGINGNVLGHRELSILLDPVAHAVSSDNCGTPLGSRRRASPIPSAAGSCCSGSD